MASYQRMVSYLYEYHEEEKGENVGYAKIEIRDSIAKMIVNIRLRRDVTAACPVELYCWRGREAGRLPVGEIHLTSGRAQERLLLPAGIPLTQMNGLRIRMSSCIIGSAWDEMPVPTSLDIPRLGNISEKWMEVPLEPQGERRKPQREVSVNYQYQKEKERMGELWAADTESPENPDKKDNNKEKEMEVERTVQVAEKTEEEMEQEGQQVQVADETAEDIPVLEVVTEEENETLTTATEPVSVRTYEMGQEKQASLPERRELERAIEAGSLPEFSLENFFGSGSRIYPRMYPFEDSSITECVRIEPVDLEYLPQELWVLGSNSFLLHGYYTYGHLILAKKKGMAEEQVILGVPGFYQNRERFLAGLFGFENFQPVQKSQSPQKVSSGQKGQDSWLTEGEFGYWYMYL